MTDGPFDLSNLFSPDTINTYLRQQGQMTQSVQPPAIDVPVREIPPPVTLHGTIKVRAVFPFDSIHGNSNEQIKQKVYDAIEARGNGAEWLPSVSLYDIDLWQEVVRVEQPDPRPAAVIAADSGGVPPQGDRGLPGDGAVTPSGTDDAGAERE